MRTRRHIGSLVVAAPIIGALLLCAGLAPSAPVFARSIHRRSNRPQTTTPIEHVVIISKENRSFDEYFGQYPGANGATEGTMSDGTVVPLVQTPDPMPHDIGHSYRDFGVAYDDGALDGFDLEYGATTKTGRSLTYSQMNEASIPNYWAYARTFGLGDNTFSDFHGTSFANNLFLVAAQSGREDPTLHYRAVNGIPQPPEGLGLDHWWGCDDPVGTKVAMLSPTGKKSSAYPCFNFSSLPQELSANDVTWNTYTNLGGVGNNHNALDGISGARNDPEIWGNEVPLQNFSADAESGNLPSVSWLYPYQTEHPVQTACAGENESVVEINAVMNSPEWANTVIFIVWDEWGGFYDHVAPPQVDNLSYGFRVPLLVISPWVKYGDGSNGGYIDSTFYSQSSILKFVEDNWSLPPLTTRDATSNNMTSFFDFGQTPKDPLLLATRTCPRLTKGQRRMALKAASED